MRLNSIGSEGGKAKLLLGTHFLDELGHTSSATRDGIGGRLGPIVATQVLALVGRRGLGLSL